MTHGIDRRETRAIYIGMAICPAKFCCCHDAGSFFLEVRRNGTGPYRYYRFYIMHRPFCYHGKRLRRRCRFPASFAKRPYIVSQLGGKWCIGWGIDSVRIYETEDTELAKFIAAAARRTYVSAGEVISRGIRRR